MRRPAMLLLIVTLLAAMTVSGCGDKFTRPRYETVYIGMPRWQVLDILGRPTEKSELMVIYQRDLPYEKAIIRFADGKVSEKFWYVSEEQERQAEAAMRKNRMGGGSAE